MHGGLRRRFQALAGGWRVIGALALAAWTNASCVGVEPVAYGARLDRAGPSMAIDRADGPVPVAGAPFADRFLDGSGRVGPSMVPIAEGRFVMGSRPTEFGYSPREVRHDVELSAYAIGRFEVTNAEFCAFLNAEGNQRERDVPWLDDEDVEEPRIRREGPGGRRFVPVDGYERHPVVTVTWLGARAYARWLSKMTGRRYRLPTEAQWECAARAGAETAWPWGEEFDASRVNWRRANDPPRAMPVGSYAANAWGVHDMIGNVWEWVLDDFDPHFYLYSPLRDPVSFERETWTPGIRGGGFRDSIELCRPGVRANYFWRGDRDSIGFRVSREGF